MIHLFLVPDIKDASMITVNYIIIFTKNQMLWVLMLLLILKSVQVKAVVKRPEKVFVKIDY